MKFHPDGHLLAIGTAGGQVKIYEIKSGMQAATFEIGAPVTQLQFSENGIWFATVVQDSPVVSIWDIRKSATAVKELEIGGKVESISWDYTGQYIVAGGSQGIVVEQYSKAAKEWTRQLRAAIPATVISWGKSAQAIVAVDETGAVTTLGGQA